MSKARDLANFIGAGGILADGSVAVVEVNGLSTALDAKAPLSSPTFTGTVAATSFSGDGSQLTGIEGVTQAALMKFGAI